MSLIELKNVSRYWGDVRAVEKLNINIEEGDNIYLVPMPFKGLFSSPIAIDKKDGKGSA